MASVLLAAKVDQPPSWPGGYAPDVQAVAAGGSVRRSFALPTGHRISVPAGSEVWLLDRGTDLGGPRGLVGHGTAADGTAAAAGQLSVDFDLLLPLGEHLPLEILIQAMPGLPWGGRTMLASLPASAVPALRRLWSGFLGPQPDPLVPAPGTLPPEALGQQHVNRYEQDPEARRMCLAFHGDSCAACGLVPGRRYGPAAADVLQAHLLVPGPNLAEGYDLDPVADLVPLCPTCHAVAHSRPADPYTPAEVRALLAAGDGTSAGPDGAVAGRMVTVREEQARQDADRLRGFR